MNESSKQYWPSIRIAKLLAAVQNIIVFYNVEQIKACTQGRDAKKLNNIVI